MAREELAAFDRRLIQLLHQHLRIFGVWSVASLGLAFIGFYFFQNAAWYFALMTLTWAIVNLGVLGCLYHHISEYRFTKSTVLKRLEIQAHTQKMILVNAGLDVLYVFIACLLLIRANYSTSYPNLFAGFSWAIMLQGAYLFCQDLLFYFLHRQHARMARPLLEQWHKTDQYEEETKTKD